MGQDEVTALLERVIASADSWDWGQGAYQKSDGTQCTVGRLYSVAVGVFTDYHVAMWNITVGQRQAVMEARNRLAGVIAEQYPGEVTMDGPADPVVLWNDTPGRTKEQVLAVFEKAARA